MFQSTEIAELAKALCKFQAEVKTVVFDKENPFFHSKYATLTAIVDGCKPLLGKYGLAVSQLTTGEGGVTTLLLHESGQYIGDTLTLKPSKDDPQGRGSAISYARRYSYASILGIVSDEDDDGNASVEQVKTSSVPQKSGGNGKPKSFKETVVEKANKCFKSADEFKAWRVDNNFAEDLSKATEVELSSIMLGLRNVPLLQR